MIQTFQKTFLAPEKHKEGFKHFIDYFKLTLSRPGLIFLHELLENFAVMPYENISKIIKYHQSADWEHPRIRLPEEVIADHIDYGLGGTCFSLTYYLQSILVQCGFNCYPVMADMRAGKNIHCCLIVILDGKKHLIDPGYLLTQPMELNLSKPRLYKTEFTGVELRFDKHSQQYQLHTFDKHEAKWRYSFRDEPASPQEFLQHWLHSFTRNSMNGICLSRIMKNGLLFVNRNFMRETTFAGKKYINIKKNYHSAINEYFGIDRQVIEQAQAALAANLRRRKELGLWVESKDRV